MVVHECYIAMLEMDDHLQTISIEEQRMVAEHIEWLNSSMTLDLNELLGSTPSSASHFVRHS